MITLTYEGHKYELEFTRDVVRNMERNGFNFAEMLNNVQPANYSFMLFSGAFAANHKRMSAKTIRDIWDHMSEKGKIIEALGLMYNETLETLVDAAAVDDGKKVTWEIS